MKITQTRKADGALKMRTLNLELALETMRHETKAQPVSNARQSLRYLSPGESSSFVEKLPKMIPAAAFRRTDGGIEMAEYNGVVQLEVNHLANHLEVAKVKAEAAELPQTLVALTGSSGKSVKIWVCFTRPDGTLPTTREEAEIFHAHAYRRAVSHYQPSLSHPVELKNPTLEQYCRLTLDPGLYYNPDSIPVYLRQPLEMPQEVTYQEAVQAEESPLRRMIPGYDSLELLSAQFEAALSKAYLELPGYRPDGDLKELLVRLVENCFRAGIPEEETARWSIYHFHEEPHAYLIRQTVHNAYLKQKGYGGKTSMTVEQELAFRTEEFMQRRYEFRYNMQMGQVEYRERNTFCFNFQPLTKRVRNSISLNALQEGLKLWDRDVDRYLDSDRVPLFRLLEDYLAELHVRWDGKDRIRELAQRVPCKNSYWPEFFRRWFLNMVAHWQGWDKKYANCTVPLLVGPQGYRKSTFCRNLIPSELQACYTDSIDFSSKKDAEMALNRYGLINIDEFDQIRPNQQAYLKHILQKPVVNVRLPHAKATQQLRRYASFIGTSNHKDLLTDSSGSRRYIGVEVTGPIDCGPIDYEQLYAQAIQLLYSRERYWFDDKDEEMMTRNNREFQVMPLAEQLYHEYFRAAEEGEECEDLMSIEILEQIQRDSGMKVSLCSIVQFGRILQSNHVPCTHTRRGNVYKVVRTKEGKKTRP